MRLDVYASGRHAGVLAREGSDNYVFSYLPDCPPESFVSLTMPVRLESYVARHLHPIFEMNLPEGELLGRILARLRKASVVSNLELLAFTGRALIGRLAVVPEDTDLTAPTDQGDLTALMSTPDTRALFNDLLDRFVERGVSGVMPKVMSLGKSKVGSRLTAADTAALYKSEDDDYPYLAFNELCCLRVVRRAGIEVPDFELSADGRVLRIERFDRNGGKALGFEDFCVLHGLNSGEKYSGSYERLVKTATTWAAADLKTATRRELFRRIVLCWMLHNGDAHQKNFGMLYPDAKSVRLSPMYDIVTTTVYPNLRHDTPALTLEGRKLWALKRGAWRRFARTHCALSDADAQRQVEELRAAVEDTAGEIEAEAADASGPLARGRAEFVAELVRTWRTGAEDVALGI